MFEFKAKSVAEFMKANGEAETLSCIKTGAQQKWYRKQKNMKDKALIEAVKKDPRYQEIVAAARRSA